MFTHEKKSGSNGYFGAKIEFRLRTTDFTCTKDRNKDLARSVTQPHMVRNMKFPC